MTLQVLPLTTGGMGGVLKATRSAALHFASLVAESAELSLYQVPELDIVAYFPERPTLPEVDHASAALFDTAMRATSDPVFLSLLKAEVVDVTRRHGRFAAEAGAGLNPGHATGELSSVRLLRSVLMKPESEDWAARLVARIEDIATTV